MQKGTLLITGLIPIRHITDLYVFYDNIQVDAVSTPAALGGPRVCQADSFVLVIPSGWNACSLDNQVVNSLIYKPLLKYCFHD